jgi:hypothetical protein
VQYTPSGGSASTVDTGSATASYTLTGLTNGTSYTVSVAAINGVGAGSYSLTATGTPVAAPSLVKLSGAGTFTGSGTVADPFVLAAGTSYLAGFGGAARFQISGSGTVQIRYNSFQAGETPCLNILRDSGASLGSGGLGTNVAISFALSQNDVFRVLADFGAVNQLRIWATA